MKITDCVEKLEENLERLSREISSMKVFIMEQFLLNKTSINNSTQTLPINQLMSALLAEMTYIYGTRTEAKTV